MSELDPVSAQPSAELLRYAQRGQLVVFAGAGISMGPPSELPGWYELNKLIGWALFDRLMQYLARPASLDRFSRALDSYRNDGAFPPDYQAQILEQNVGDDYFKALQCLDVDTVSESHRSIARLAKQGGVKAIVTTNFDRLIEIALEAEGLDPLVGMDPASFKTCFDSLEERRTIVLKVHGCVSNHRSMIDTLKQRLLGRNEYLEKAVKELLGNSYAVYAGFSAADLESDETYLGLLEAAANGPGLTYIQFPGGTPSVGSKKLLDAAGGGQRVVAHVDQFVSETAKRLSAAHGEAKDPGEGWHQEETPPTILLVRGRLEKWANDLTPAATVNCIASLAEAAGATNLGFEMLHRFWKDVAPTDRDGPDFHTYRLHHGRMGMGQGLLSIVEDMGSTAGEESFQNLLRVGWAGDSRGLAVAGLASMWAGQTKQALQLFTEAWSKKTEATELEVWLALAEAGLVLGNPEMLLEDWKRFDSRFEAAGELPMRAMGLALACLGYAEYAPDEFERVLRESEPVLEAAQRLNHPSISAFLELASGRFGVKGQSGAESVREHFQNALQLLGRAGRPPWSLYAEIELAKAEFDGGDVGAASDRINGLDARVDRYQVWLPRLFDTAGQFHLALGQRQEAQQAFGQAIEYAEAMHLSREVQRLRKQLAIASSQSN